MKHDEKKIEELNNYLKTYIEPTQLNGTDYYLIPMQKVDHNRKQYAEHMVQQERKNIIKDIRSYPKLYSDKNIDGEFLHYPTYKTIINLISK